MPPSMARGKKQKLTSRLGRAPARGKHLNQREDRYRVAPDETTQSTGSTGFGTGKPSNQRARKPDGAYQRQHARQRDQLAFTRNCHSGAAVDAIRRRV